MGGAMPDWLAYLLVGLMLAVILAIVLVSIERDYQKSQEDQFLNEDNDIFRHDLFRFVKISLFKKT